MKGEEKESIINEMIQGGDVAKGFFPSKDWDET